MTKQDLIHKAALRASVSPEDTRAVINAVFSLMKSEVQSGGEVTLRGFGTLKSVHRAAKPARNISKRETIIIPAHRAVAFKPARDFNINAE